MEEITVIKRDGSEVPFKPSKIKAAILKAGYVDEDTLKDIAHLVQVEAQLRDNKIDIETIQDLVEEALFQNKYFTVCQEYIRYRTQRTMIRNSEEVNDSILKLIDDKNQYLRTENSNKNHAIASTQRDYIAGEVSKDITMRLLLPPEVVEAHKRGAIHFHDSDYFVQHEFNCCLVNLEDILQNGTVINGTLIEKPHSFSTACNIATQVAAIVASNQYGGQTMSLAHLAPFVEETRKKARKEAKKLGIDYIDDYVRAKVMEDIKRGVQTIQYQVNTLNSSNGQTPFITIWAYLNEAKSKREKEDLALIIEEVLEQRLLGVKNEQGVYVSPAFPKIIYALEEDNINENGRYWYLTKLAAKCSAKRLVPDYISEKVMLKLKGACFPSMGCRSFLSPYEDKDGKLKFYGRFNQGVCTLNLPYIALEARERNKKYKTTLKKAFFRTLKDYVEICHTALRARHGRLLNTSSSISPLHWNYGAIARLPKGSQINELLFGGYSTMSLGYAGLYEASQVITKMSHTKGEGFTFAKQVLQALNIYCDSWKKIENIGYSVYGTPLESTTYKFAQAIQRDFGKIKEVSDHDYITNSFHVNVREPIDPFEKLELEAKFQELSQGGCISYIETANLQDNVDAVMEVIKYIYDHIMYAELNTKSDYCMKCGYSGEITIKEFCDGSLQWCCPNCGNKDLSQMNITRRTCGYLGTNYWNHGRTQEIKDRYVHLDSCKV